MNPCPFCGGKKAFIKTLFRPYYGDMCAGWCPTCGCQGPEARIKLSAKGDNKKAMTEALIKWNGRKV